MHFTRRRRAGAGVALVVALLVGVGIGRAGQGAGGVAGRAPSAGGPVSAARDQEPGPLPEIGAGTTVDRDDVGDPTVLPVPAGADGPKAFYVLFYTTDWRSNVPTAVSTDLVHWQRVADALPVLPSWAVDSRSMTWGPSAQRVAGGWVLYFSTEDAANREECIGSAFATTPTGPYTDRSSRPLVCQAAAGGSIDPSVIRHGGTSTLVWKREGSAIHQPASIWSQRLTADGQGVTGRPHRLLRAGLPWQHGNIEGPAMLADTRGGFWLFYAGDSWRSTTYDTGVAWCATTAGPCREASRTPLLQGSPGADSPGGFATFVANDGRLMASWSAFPEAPADPRQAEGMDRDLVIGLVLRH